MSNEASQPPRHPPRRRTWSRREHTPAQRIQHVLHGNPALSPLIVLVLGVIVFGIFADNFLRPQALSLLVQQMAVVGALAVGQTLIILTAGIDLSIGMAMVLSSLVMVKLNHDQGVPGLIALLIGIAVGAAHRPAQRRAGDPAQPAAVHRHARHVLDLHGRLAAVRRRARRSRSDRTPCSCGPARRSASAASASPGASS